ncbi:MAG: hypothetical protein MUF18_18760 [Fimbriiglobus sp.]|jgi:hypothetical protein|nr:hypothetical protein [Fimbriiglobus sp.]
MSTAPTLPSPEKIKAYADELPEIYRLVLSALHAADPDRRYGEGVVPTLLWQQLAGVRSEYVRREYLRALEELEGKGFLYDDDENGLWGVTPLGEELLAAVTGKRAKNVVVPPLPKLNW